MLAPVSQQVQAAWSKRPGILRGRNLIIIGVLLVAVIIGWSMMSGGEEESPYRTAAVERGSITRVVSATGTLEPVIKANVGSTVSGPVQAVLVDFNSQVRVGQVLARLDPAPFQQRVVQAQATLAQQQAQLASAEADYQRYVLLQQRGFASEQLMSQQRASRDSARAAVQSAQAQLSSARTDLERSVIRSPIDGVVVDRQVNVGQAVAASMQAATLFVVAQDLSRLQANITVDEADIGDVREGMPVRFTVDAFADREFEGRVSQVRQQGVASNGVVSYTVVVEANNPGRTLLPGMTANAEIVLEQQENVLRLPNTALRYRPADEALQARAQALRGEASAGGDRAQGGGQGAQGGQRGGAAQIAERLELTPEQTATLERAFQNGAQAAMSGGAGDPRAGMRRVRDAALREIEPTLNERQRELLAAMRENGGGRAEVRRQAVVWTLRDGKPEPVQVTIGVADSSHTLLYEGLDEGAQVITGGGDQAAAGNRGGFGGGGPGGGGPGMGIRGT